MGGELSTAVNECTEIVETPRLYTIRNVRLVGVAFGICCYMSFAALYFLRPTNPVIALGPARFTVDALLELAFTFLALPCFGAAYFFGIRHHEENPKFAVPGGLIDLLFVVAIVWVAVGNGIHLTAKLDEQIVSPLNGQQVSGIRANFHWIRQVVGHVFPHLGWQLLFCTLMLGQLKRPYRGERPKALIPYCGIVFGALFAHGTIAGACTHLGFVLTVISCLGFLYLRQKSKLLPAEIPILRFFMTGQVTFMLTIAVYWVVFRSVSI
jgi:hypothetical protein